MSSIKVYTKKISPEEAMRFLKRNSINRKLSQRHVDFYHSQMVDGNWLSTGDAIQFNTKGQLINGQHRMHALIKYGKPLEFTIVENVPDQAFKILDTGKNRSAADALSILGYRNVFNMAGTARSILLFKLGRYNTQGGQGGSAGKRGVSNQEIVEFVEANRKEIEEIVRHVGSQVYQQFRHMNPTVLCALYYFFSRKDQKACDDFFEKYATGIDLGRTDPIRILRERLMKDTTNRTKLNLRDRTALHVMAWNFFRQKKQINSIALVKGYEFPKIL